DPHYIKAYNNLGSALAQMGDAAGARKTLERAIEINPGYKNSYKNLAMVYIQEKKPKEAFDYMKRYIELDPGDEGAAHLLEQLRIVLAGDTL
ncbi:MAG: tetratricopeptide repeat protein, partial [Candidatus Latescibacterota bacterium]